MILSWYILRVLLEEPCPVPSTHIVAGGAPNKTLPRGISTDRFLCELRTLVDLRLVRRHDDAPVRLYEITEAGRQRYKELVQ